ncbi:MAG: hypothetical protein V2I66_08150 [Halieaceae bacterium]|jgi:hypothetical protein|nr:hypothetical protein [Halieaceae bacterium]
MCQALDQRNEKLGVIRNQHTELVRQSNDGTHVLSATVTCPCDRERGISRAVRCLYCSIWYCETCAEEHFGMTRAEYRAQQVEKQDGE